jgi:hypothetical protein
MDLDSVGIQLQKKLTRIDRNLQDLFHILKIKFL